MAPTYSFVIATYQRPAMLLRCLSLAVSQTRLPKQVIVIDASPDWESTRQQAQAAFQAIGTSVPLVYNQAERASSAFQRNQGAAHCSANVVVFIDDDSLLFADCAEEFMRPFDLDTDHCVAGVGMILVMDVPDMPVGSAERGEDLGARKRGFRGFVRRLLGAENIFVPYDYDFPKHSVPNWIDRTAFGVRATLTGNRMAVRTSIVLKEPFEQLLERYASGEDSDMSYRASRHGLLLTAFRARVCHMQAPGGRLSQCAVTALGCTNPMALHRVYGQDQDRSRTESYRLLRRRLIIELTKDLCNGSVSFPRTRGVLIALKAARTIFGKSVDELRLWYPQFQHTLIRSYRSAN